MRIKRVTIICCIFLSIFVYSKTMAWTGKWYRNSLQNNAELIITNLKDSSFDFKIIAYSGALTGVIEDKAKIKGNIATCMLNEKEKREIQFELTDMGVVVSSKNCEGYYGAEGVIFDGKFISKMVPEVKLADKVLIDIIKDKELVNKIKNILGKSYTSFVYTLHVISTDECTDNFKATVISGCVAGLCNELAGIIMFTPEKSFYLAWYDEQGVHYYTSDKRYESTPPKTIGQWMEMIGQ